MSGHLKVDTGDLRTAGTSLRSVATEFSGAGDIADGYADAVGHGGLAERLRDFADEWDDRRAEMTESIAALAEVASKAGELYDEIESELVRCLTEQPQ